MSKQVKQSQVTRLSSVFMLLSSFVIGFSTFFVHWSCTTPAVANDDSSCQIAKVTPEEGKTKVVFTCGLQQKVVEIPHGKDGKDGNNGKDGNDGKDGQDGKDGKDGAKGQNGKDGQNGRDGKDSLLAFKVTNLSQHRAKTAQDQQWTSTNQSAQLPGKGSYWIVYNAAFFHTNTQSSRQDQITIRLDTATDGSSGGRGLAGTLGNTGKQQHGSVTIVHLFKVTAQDTVQVQVRAPKDTDITLNEGTITVIKLD